MNYELSRLDSEDFEQLSADIVGKLYSCNVETYKKGRDGGVDGKFKTFDNAKGIIQAKHWYKSSLSTLLSKIRQTEVFKAKKLKADKYILVTSLELNGEDKKKILKDFQGCIKHSSDIIGFHEIQRFLDSNADIVKKHYKLWISSSAVLDLFINKDVFGDSGFTLKEIYDQSKFYVQTSAHRGAIEKLNLNDVVIITGVPGIGKTTLAKNICLHYSALGYDLVDLGIDIKTASRVYEESKKQIFYYDDFLGKNFIDAVNDKHDSAVVKFIRRVQNSKHKKFVLTSRSNILTKRKKDVECYDESKVYKHEFEILVSEILREERARILYSHVYHSDLNLSYKIEFVKDKFYNKVIDHQNYSPRIIEFLFDKDRIDDNLVSVETYQYYILESLNNPRVIWERSFQNLGHVQKMIVMLVAFSGRSAISEIDLKKAYDTFKCIDPKAGSESALSDFLADSKELAGAFIKRNVTDHRIYYEAYNPSLIDYILIRYKADASIVSLVFYLYESVGNLNSLVALYRREQDLKSKVVEQMFSLFERHGMNKRDSYFQFFLRIYTTCLSDGYSVLGGWLKEYDYSKYTPTNIDLSCNNLKVIESSGVEIVPEIFRASFLYRCIDSCTDVDDFLGVSNLIESYRLRGDAELVQHLSESLESYFEAEVSVLVDDESLLDDYLPDDSYDAQLAVENHIVELVSDFIPEVSISEDSIASFVDIDQVLQQNFKKSIEGQKSEFSTSLLDEDEEEGEYEDIFEGLELH